MSVIFSGFWSDCESLCVSRVYKGTGSTHTQTVAVRTWFNKLSGVMSRRRKFHTSDFDVSVSCDRW